MSIFRSIAITCIAVGILSPFARADDVRPPDKVSFYFAAHEDDWQLFMGPSAFQDVVNGKAKVVFIHVTAGDAGLGTGQGGRKYPYYLAREHGAEAAIHFMAAPDYQPPYRETASRMTFNGHEIYRESYRNTVAYFLRLPDGSPTGSGYQETGYQSLRRLAAGQIASFSAIDGSATYHGWTDLVSTLRAILDYERGNAPFVWLNVAELDQTINPNDHPDHLMTAKAALEAAKALTCARRLYYVDYASARLPENLDSQQRDMQSSVFAVTLAAVQEFDHTTAWHHYDQSFVGRNYFRVQDGTGRCQRAGLQAAATRPEK